MVINNDLYCIYGGQKTPPLVPRWVFDSNSPTAATVSRQVVRKSVWNVVAIKIIFYQKIYVSDHIVQILTY